ncbi:ankyrin repeat domain-containing protein [Pseudomonas sp. UBA6562]|uniref:ankyrin repeat domain-containing protein n=1 Tax=Pseudomonas sp. UBA6562 TaxID=1947332 RepID=UPI0025CE2C01|nr:ankyrin repeat domain-containing protein [Pseudomonas sp. UBA6562]
MSKALLKAAASGQTPQLQTLLANGTHIDFTDKATGRTALIEAAIKGHTEAVKVLIENGADRDATDDVMGYTVLGWAASEGHTPLVHFLLEAGTSVDLTTSIAGRTPLMDAASGGHDMIVAALLSAGAKVHLQTGDGRNALSIAQERGHASVVALLLEHGAVAPVMPEESYLPWPSVSPDLSDIDDTDPASVLRGFLLAMHRWETGWYELSKSQTDDNPLDWSAIQDSQNRIFERFCTPKPRTYGRLGSFGFPPTYAPEDMLISIEPLPRRTLLMTRQAPDAPVRYETLFSLVKKGGVWRVDTKKKRVWGWAEDWETGIL